MSRGQKARNDEKRHERRHETRKRRRDEDAFLKEKAAKFSRGPRDEQIPTTTEDLTDSDFDGCR